MKRDRGHIHRDGKKEHNLCLQAKGVDIGCENATGKREQKGGEQVSREEEDRALCASLPLEGPMYAEKQ